MPFISGIYYRNGRSAGSHIIDIARNTCKGEVAVLASGNILLLAQQNTTNQYTDAETGLTLVGDIDIYNVQELATALDSNIAGQPPTAEALITKAYKKWGAACVQHLSGEFAFAIMDSRNGEVFCARDHIGHKPLYYYLDAETFIFSNKMHFLGKFTCSAQLNEAYIKKLLFKSYTAEDRGETIYTQVHKLVPAHTLTVQVGAHKLEKYWDLNNNKQQQTTTKHNNIDESAQTLRWYIDNAVKQRVAPTGKNGIELSGGLDSSGVAVFAQQYLEKHNDGLLAFSNALPHSHKNYYKGFSDESERIEIIKNRLGIKQHIHIDQLGDNPVGALEKAVEYIGYPSSVTINISQQPIYTAARSNNVTTLLSGFGGDEMVSANLYNIYLELLVKSGELQKASAQVQQKGYSPLKSYAHVYMRYARHLLHMQETGIAQTENDEMKRLLFHDHVIKTTKREDSHIHSIREWYRLKINYPGLLERLETGYLVTANYGLKYKYPLLDVSLLEYFYNLPDEWKTGHRHGRALFRKALEGLLPDEVLQGNKARNTFVVPVLKIEMELYFTHLRDWILALPHNHRLFDYANRSRVEKLVKDSRTEARVYEMMRKLIMLAMFFNKQNNQQLHEP